MMRTIWLAVFLSSLVTLAVGQQHTVSAGAYKLKIVVEGVNEQGGNIGVLVFNSPKGWPDDRLAALHDIVVGAHPGTVTIDIPSLPAGTYALAVVHDVNKNHKLDKSWLGKPLEQWGMSNNPHATFKAPSFSAAQFTVSHDLEIHVQMQ